MPRKPYTRYSREFKLEAVRQAALGEKPKAQIGAVARDSGRPFARLATAVRRGSAHRCCPTPAGGRPGPRAIAARERKAQGRE
jgi:hypothetical protein